MICDLNRWVLAARELAYPTDPPWVALIARNQGLQEITAAGWNREADTHGPGTPASPDGQAIGVTLI